MRKRFLSTKKVILALILLAGLSGMGMTYSAWSADGIVTTGLYTGNFSIIFSGPEEADYMFAIVDGEGNILEELDADVLIEEDGKRVLVQFRQGLPVELLIQGNYIKLEYPLEAAPDGTVTAVQTAEADLESDGERIQMDARSGALLADGNILEGLSVLESFMEPLEFYVYRETAAEPGALNGTMFLKLTEESIEYINGLPETVELGADFIDQELEGSGQETGLDEVRMAEDYGVVVTYSCDILFYLNQKEAEMDASGEWRDG